MTYLGKLKASGIPIGWSALLVGWDGVDGHGRLVSSEEVTAYAAEQLEFVGAPHYSEVLALAGANPSDEEGIRRALSTLAECDREIRADGVRPWRLLLLKETIQELDEDPLYDLIRLTEFWASFDYPTDMPHVAQGVGNRISPTEYYTESMLKQSIHRHLEWIEKEERILRQT